MSTTSATSQLAALGWKSTEAYRIAAAELVDGLLVHPLALAVHLAFAQHRPLVLTPDAVWLCIAQSLATHIELHAEALRPRLVRHTGQLELELRRDDLAPGDPDNAWPAVVDGLVAQIRAHLGGRADMFLADFSTTTPLDHTASQIALMGAMRQYFQYSVGTLCGIPEITLMGTPEDWAAIRRRVDAFAEFDLAWWVEVLDPVLAKLEATARGDIDREFWRRLYKHESASGGDRAHGWLNTLFAYVGDRPVRNPFQTIDEVGFFGYGLEDFPSGRTRVPFTWKLFGESVVMELVGGLWGVTQDERGALGVASGWVISHAYELSDFERSAGEVGELSRLSPRRGVMLENLASLSLEASDEPINLTLMNTDRLRSLEGIQHLRGLVELTVYNAPLLENLAPLADMTSLARLDLHGCSRLANLEHLPGLVELTVHNSPLLENLAPLAGMTSLARLDLRECPRLANLEHLHGLVELTVHNAPLLENLAPLTGITSLVRLDLRECPRLANLGSVLETLLHLEILCLIDTGQLTLADYLPVARMSRLSYLVLWDCMALPEHLRCMHRTPEAIAEVQAVLAALG
ncbi:MAG TPA: DUF4419 domain-containing protein [Kofleriaceae bacterium]|nr:DUF4419 domain-containing protein [Kofleriaceae bacterium]